jgi:hypothetical protein
MSGFQAPNLYLDPGTGSIIIQVVLASVLGFMFIIRTKISSAFKWIWSKLFKKEE